MINIQKLTKKILIKQGFKEHEITSELFDELQENISNFYINHILYFLKDDDRTQYLLLLKNNASEHIIGDFCREKIKDYDQFICDLTLKITSILLTQ